MMLEQLLPLYKAMLKTRLFDSKAINLQRTGKLGTYPSCLWHEAIGVAIGASMQSEDIFCPYYRDLGTMLWRGVLMEEILAYWGGYSNGNNFKHNKTDFPYCVPIASQTLHAVGAAFACKYQKNNKIVITTIGDGGTSRGDFYEALNIASLWNLPIVFVIINNQWAISTPLKLQTKNKALFQKGLAAGISGEQIDGNDIVALTEKLAIVINNARESNTPYILEALTYRMGDHTTADDANRYRDNTEKQQYLATDPVLRCKKLLEQYNFTEEDNLKLIQEIQAEIDSSINNYLNLAAENPKIMFDNLYYNLPDYLKLERDLL